MLMHKRFLSCWRAEAKPRDAMMLKTRETACRWVLYEPMEREALGLVAFFFSPALAVLLSMKAKTCPWDGSHERHLQPWAAQPS